MIKHLGHQDIDFAKWDACIQSAAESRIYAHSWYLDLVTGSRWEALVEDDYQAVCPLPCRSKWGIAYIYTPFFVQQLGIFSKEPLSTGQQNDFLQAIPARFKLTELNLNSGNEPTDPDFTFVRNSNFELSLDLPYDQLKNQYSENLKRNLKKSKAEHIAVIATENPDQVIGLFRAERGRDIGHWGDPEYRQFQQLTKSCSEKEKTCILSAYDKENEFIAGAVFFITPDRAIFIFSATGAKAKAGGAMAALIDFFICEHSDHPMILDFEGSNDPGLARFYASFGATETIYFRAVRNRLPGYVNLIRRIKKPG